MIQSPTEWCAAILAVFGSTLLSSHNMQMLTSRQMYGPMKWYGLFIILSTLSAMIAALCARFSMSFVMPHMCFFVKAQTNVFSCWRWHQKDSHYLCERAFRVFVLEGDLPRRLKDGTIRLLRVAWLRDYKGRKLPRRQDLPKDAFVSLGMVANLLKRRRVAVLSYRWLSREHPDPDGFHLNVVKNFCINHVMYEALFWDFGSLPQKPRTQQEQTQFVAGLSAMIHLYASPNTLVLQHKRLPVPTELLPYESSGWCRCEQEMSRLAGLVMVLGEQDVPQQPAEPASVKEMTKFFKDKKNCHFNGNADREMVAEMYQDFKARVSKFRIWSESAEQFYKQVVFYRRPGVRTVHSFLKSFREKWELKQAIIGFTAICALCIFARSFYIMTVFCLEKQNNNANAMMVPFVAWLGFKLAMELVLSSYACAKKLPLLHHVAKCALLCVMDPTSWISDTMLIKQVFIPDDDCSNLSIQIFALVTLVLCLACCGAILRTTLQGARAKLEQQPYTFKALAGRAAGPEYMASSVVVSMESPDGDLTSPLVGAPGLHFHVLQDQTRNLWHS